MATRKEIKRAKEAMMRPLELKKVTPVSKGVLLSKSEKKAYQRLVTIEAIPELTMIEVPSYKKIRKMVSGEPSCFHF